MAQAASGNGVSSRVVSFAGQLRTNGFAVGPGDVADALLALQVRGISQLAETRRTLKITLCSCAADWKKFDDMFEAFWLRRGSVRRRAHDASKMRSQAHAPIWAQHLGESIAAGKGRDAPAREAPPGDQPIEGGRKARLAASNAEVVARTDMRNFVAEADRQEAEQIALRLARAMRFRLSRRWRQQACGSRINLRRTIRNSIARGGTPLRLVHQARPDRPVRIAALLDISGSMKPYSGFFMHFMRGLVSCWLDADAYLFHTRLLRATGWLRDRNAGRAMESLVLAAGGLDSGTRIAASLRAFNDLYAKRTVNSRTVVVILSDGYDTDEPALLATELARLKRRARKLVWLNPMLGWRNYEPVTRSMRAALPYIDAFAEANTLEGLKALEGQLQSL